MIILDVNKVSKSFGFGNVLNNVSFSINEGEKIAVVGENGCGKTTLMKLIARIERPDEGIISLKKDTVVEYLEQGDVSDSKHGNCGEILKSAFEALFEMQNKLNSYELEICSAKDEQELNSLIKRYSALQEKFLFLGGYDIDVQINQVVNGLQIDKSLLSREYSTLSGGERTLINLAKILLSRPDLLLLDEPTNHLDISRLEWLESYINSYRGTIIIVSHDRYFLDKVCQKIIELKDGKIKTYIGNYSKYQQQKEDEEVKEFAIYKVQQKKISEMEKAIKRLKEWGKLADNPTFFRRAKAIQSNLNRLKENAIEKPKDKKVLPIKFSLADRGSQNVVFAKNLYLKVAEKELLHEANFAISNCDKVAIVGENGCGKSTLIKAILSKTEGINIGNNQKIGYLSQIIEFDDLKQSVLQCFIDGTGLFEQSARSILFNFQFFKKEVIKQVGHLSGGEKLRLKLAIMLQQEINLLILDEPTNHIDINTREVLEDSLSSFKGTLIFVSHDRFFINKIANKIIEFHNKELYTFQGNYDDYVYQKEHIHSIM